MGITLKQNSHKMVFSGVKLFKQDGSEVCAEATVNNADVVVVYFSAHWCPPCRGFTPVLKDFWEEVKDDKVVIMFVSSDRDDASAKDYFNSMGDYYLIPHGSDCANTLKQNCEVRGIPSLCVIGKDGKLLHNGGRADVTGKGKGCVADWKKLY